jgi:protein O-mannosyl-transferase
MSKGKKLKRRSVAAAAPVVKKKPALAHVQESIPTRWKLVIAAALAVLAMAVYAPSYNYDFVYDDDAVVKDNRFVHDGIEGLDEIWTTSYFQGYDEGIIARAYRPVPLTTLALEYEIWGLNATVNHLFNLLFYGLTGFFLFLMLSKLLRDHHPALPVITCLLFLLHPIHLEVVANIKSRDTMLGFLNFTLAAWFLLKHLDNRKILPLVLSLVFYSIGLFSKESVLTSLAVIPLMLYFFRDFKPGQIVKTMIPYAGAVAVFLIARSSVLGGLNEGVTLSHLDNSLLAADGFAQRSASNLLVLGHYLLKTVFPHPLISDYSYATLPLVNWDDWRVYAALMANLGLLAVGIHGLVKRKIYGFGALQYFAAVSIFTSIIVTNVSAYNDRFLYTPVLGICFLIAWLLTKLIKNTPETEGSAVTSFFKNNFVAVAVVAVLASLSILKIESHLPYWKDRYVLFDHDVKLAPNNARMRKNHGGSLARIAVDHQKDDPAKAREYAQLAITELDAALAIYPNIPTGYIHKGNMHIILGNYTEAETALREALKYDPDNYFSLTSLGNLLYRTGRFDEAATMMDNIPAELRKPNDYYIMSLIHERLGNQEKSKEYFRLSGR